MRRLTAALLTVAVATTVTDRVRTADDVRRSWGSTSTVLVARRDLPAGTPLEATQFLQVDWPDKLLPDGPASGLDPGVRLRQPVGRGEILLTARLDPTGRGELAARLGPDERAVRARLAVAMHGLVVEDLVDVVPVGDPLVLGTPTSGSTGAGVAPLTRRARVLRVDEDAVTLAVAAADAARVAAPGAAQGVTLVVRR